MFLSSTLWRWWKHILAYWWGRFCLALQKSLLGMVGMQVRGRAPCRAQGPSSMSTGKKSKQEAQWEPALTAFSEQWKILRETTNKKWVMHAVCQGFVFLREGGWKERGGGSLLPRGPRWASILGQPKPGGKSRWTPDSVCGQKSGGGGMTTTTMHCLVGYTGDQGCLGNWSPGVYLAYRPGECFWVPSKSRSGIPPTS